MKVTIICWELQEIFICHFHQRRPLLGLLPNQASVLYKKLLCPIWVRKALSTASKRWPWPWWTEKEHYGPSCELKLALMCFFVHCVEWNNPRMILIKYFAILERQTVMSVLGRRLALVSRDLLGMSSVCACRGKISLVSASHSDFR